jgi:type I restriction enzyme S subunit
MELRVKEICKAQGITLQALADRLGINRVNLSISINGNPTLEKMTEIANALGVTVNDLLPEPQGKTIKGYIELDNQIIKVQNINDLKRIIHDYEKFEIDLSKQNKYYLKDCVVFRSQEDEFGAFSNMANGFPLEINGIKTHGVDTLYQAMKFPKYPEIQKIAIEATNLPSIEKQLKQYCNSPFIREDWEEVKVAIMEWCIKVKYVQHWVNLKVLMNKTHNKPIVELSMKDKFWGVVPLKKNPDCLTGMNVTGQIWMKIRQERSYKSINPLEINDFTLYNKPIEVVKLF